MTGIELIAKERQEQIEKHGFDAKHDARPYNSHGELVQAASYLLCKFSLVSQCHPSDLRFAVYPSAWNSDWKVKFDEKNDLESLITAGALIAAEIDRILNLKNK